MNIDISYIEELVKVLNSNGLTELSLEDKGQSITLKKDCSVPVAQTVITTPEVQQKTDVTVSEKGKAITSPMVGTFYSSLSPDNPSLVKIGDTISKGDVVCVIEAMKLMNEIVSEHSGIITEICVEDGQPVEYGQILMYVK